MQPTPPDVPSSLTQRARAKVTGWTPGSKKAARDAVAREEAAREEAAREEMAGAFDHAWYARCNPDVVATGMDPLLHYVRFGADEGRDPNPLFDATWYAEQNPDVATSGLSPFLHYVRHGAVEGRDPNPLFDADWYLAMYPDVAAAGLNPVLHYLQSGAAQGRNPNPLFDTSWYSESYPDVVRTAVNPLVQYLHHGEQQGRLPGPLGLRRTVPRAPTAFAAGSRPSRPRTRSEAADVTILVPVHGAWHWTERCLHALDRTEAVHRARVLVVDDASPDDTADRLRAFPWVQVVTAEQNLGFVGAVNLGLKHVRTPHLLLLNNDTEPLPGFLDAMVGRLQQDDVAVVGARLVYPDGRLQDAGSIIWLDGTGWNYGRHGDPDEPAYLHARDVDYCTGAALLVRTKVLRETGGLDNRYRPAYYEDADLAFAVRARGWRVVYEPGATVVHHEGGTHGTDENVGGKSQQVVNRDVFRAKWRAELRMQTNHGEVPLAVAATRGLKPIVVFVDQQPLTPDKDAGSFRALQLLTIMQELGYTVVFAALHGAREMEPEIGRLRARGVQVIRDTETMRDLLRTCGSWVEAVVLSRVDVACEWLTVVRGSSRTVPVVFDTVDLHHLRQALEAELHDDRLGRVRATSTERRELDMIARCDATIVVSETERAYLTTRMPDADVTVISNIHPLPDQTAPWTGRSGVIFVGSFLHTPNVDGLGWFLREVWPLVDPAVRRDGIDVIGSSIPPDLAAFASDEVRIRGWVPDVVPFLQAARVSVAPLRYGAGVKGKIGEAWSFGLPVVGTSAALEAMHTESNPVGLVADDPNRMAQHIAEVYLDDALWGRVSEAGRRRVTECLSRDQAASCLTDLLQRIGELRPRPDLVSDLRRRRIPPHLLRPPTPDV